MTVKRNPNFDKELNRMVKKGLVLAGTFTKKKIKDKVGRSGGPSNPGEAPAKDSGVLQDSIQVDVTQLSSNKISVGSDEDYGAYLEAGTLNIQPRPYLRNTFRENKKEIINQFNKGGKK